VNTIEELFGRKNSGSSLENRDYGATPLYPQKLALTSPTSGGRSVGIVRLRAQAREFVLFLLVAESELRKFWKETALA
jgi:hypothetical protein